MQEPKIAASILSADFARLGEEVDTVLAAGANMIHFDVMDNHYVPNLTVGPVVCKALRKFGVKAPIDVHLMTEPVDGLIEAFATAGANYISFHPEASKHVDRSIQLIKDCGAKAALAFNPATPLVYLDHALDKLDMILLMSVNPGFECQEFIPEVLEKISIVRSIIDESKLPIRLEVDGGIKVKNIRKIFQAGADTFVIGSGIFYSKDYVKTIASLHAELAKT